MTRPKRGIPFLPMPKSITESGTSSQLGVDVFRKLTPTRGQLNHLPQSVSLITQEDFQSDQAYSLEISSLSIKIQAAGQLGWHYGLLTLNQIALASEDYLPVITVEDHPDFSRRGIMLDVSRNKVPKLETLFYLIDLFSSWKINELQLYIEHAFTFEGHEAVWRNASPLTQDDIKHLDAYCQERFIELVPNLNCFGHMSRWLIHEPYNQLAEQPEGGETDFGYRPEPQGLCPIDPGSIKLAQDLIEQITACFESKQVNVGCDETIDLGFGRSKQAVKENGRGQVYLDYLQKVHSLCENHGYRMQFWADILLKYPELMGEVPSDSLALNWGYEAIHPFEEETAHLGSSDLQYYVCPGTSSWNSIGGRTENMLGNIRKAASMGKRNDAVGLLTTDWGDNGHLQPLVASFPGFAFGSACAWNQDKEIDLSTTLDLHVFQNEGWGQLLLDIGNLDQAFDIYIHNQSVLFQILNEDESFIRKIENLNLESLQVSLTKAIHLQQAFKALKKDHPIERTIMEEVGWVLKMLIHACHRGQAILLGDTLDNLHKEALELRTQHKELWHIRNRPGEYVLSRKSFDSMIES